MVKAIHLLECTYIIEIQISYYSYLIITTVSQQLPGLWQGDKGTRAPSSHSEIVDSISVSQVPIHKAHRHFHHCNRPSHQLLYPLSLTVTSQQQPHSL